MNALEEILVVALLLFANGVFAMSEIAVVSSRKVLLKKLAEGGSRRARMALQLATGPDRFLSTVQIGITLVGVLAGAFGGATLSLRLERVLAPLPHVGDFAGIIAFILVIGTITFLSIIIGELVPKRIALSNPESRAMLVAAPMLLISRVAAPLVWLLTTSQNAVLRLFGLDREVKAPPSEEEVAHLMAEGTSAGVFHKSESYMVEGVLRLDERPVTEIMTHRTQIVFLDIEDSDEDNWRKIVASGHSHFPVYQGTPDNVLGLVSVKALWANTAAGVPSNLRVNLTKPLFVPNSLSAVQVLETFRKTRKQRALVTDEFGGVQGMVCLMDVMTAIVGELPEPGIQSDPDVVEREDGSFLVDGALPVGELRRRFALPTLPGEADTGFVTLGGFVVDMLGAIPRSGAKFSWNDWTFEVVDMDRHRVDKVLMTRLHKSESDRDCP
jgi:putative hemolysin